MKIFKVKLSCFCIILIIFSLFSTILFNNKVYAQSSCYARIVSNGAYFYRNAIDDNNFENIYCVLEKTYFVEIIEKINDDFYMARYFNLMGYVKSQNVLRVSGTPKNPFPSNVSITVANAKCNLRKYPEINDNVVSVIPANSTSLSYIGKMYGSEAVDYMGNIWYFVEYYGVYGYIYSNYLYTVSLIHQNTEELAEYSYFSENTINPFSNLTSTIIIGLMVIPALFLLLILYKPPKLKKNSQIEKNNTKGPIKKENKYDFDNWL